MENLLTLAEIMMAIGISGLVAIIVLWLTIGEIVYNAVKSLRRLTRITNVLGRWFRVK